MNQEKVAAVFSGYCSNDSTEFSVYADAGLPVFHLNTLQANVDYVTDKKITNIYQGCPSETWYGKGFVPLMQYWIDTGAWKPSSRTVAIVTSNDPYSISIAQAFKTERRGDRLDRAGLRGGHRPERGLGPGADQDPEQPARPDLRHRLHRRRPGQLRQAVRRRAHAVAALPAVRPEHPGVPGAGR